MIISGFQKSSLIDFPDKIAAIVFTQGCNFKCGYCHNPELVTEPIQAQFDEHEILNFLNTRINKLDGVVITGGEPTLQNDLKRFISKIKSLDFAVKLDTNGTNPMLLDEFVTENLIDYIAMDIKGPIKKYNEITQMSVDINNILKSIKIILNSKIDHEFRTTVVSEQLNSIDFDEIGIMIQGAEKYFLQKFVPSKHVNSDFINKKSITEDELQLIKNKLEKYIKNVYIR